jgi:hypothetical protein
MARDERTRLQSSPPGSTAAIFFNSAGEQTLDDILLFRRSLALHWIIIPAGTANPDVPFRTYCERQHGRERQGQQYLVTGSLPASL